jgi:hypothetical protein
MALFSSKGYRAKSSRKKTRDSFHSHEYAEGHRSKSYRNRSQYSITRKPLRPHHNKPKLPLGLSRFSLADSPRSSSENLNPLFQSDLKIRSHNSHLLFSRPNFLTLMNSRAGYLCDTPHFRNKKEPRYVRIKSPPHNVLSVLPQTLLFSRNAAERDYLFLLRLISIEITR